MTTMDNLRVGQIIDGRYELRELLGRGGMGCVYRAEHRAIRKPVALKLLAPIGGEMTEVDRARFEREAFATGRLKHPNCVAITDFGRLKDGTLYFAMELLEGRSLSDLLDAEDRLEPARALRIARHILEGLAHAHELGIVHRDLKPPNVMLVEHLGDREFAKVLDFGLAKLQGEVQSAEGGGKLTVAGVTFGTPHYMSPEQAFGNPVDHRSDLYAVSVMLFEMLAGDLPFDGPDIRSILFAHGTRVVPRLSEVAPGLTVPTEIEMLIRQGMAKDPRDRVQSAREYVERIDACLAPRRVAPAPAVALPEARAVVDGTTPTVPLVPAAARQAAASPGSRGVAVGIAAAIAVAAMVAAVALPTSTRTGSTAGAHGVEPLAAEVADERSALPVEPVAVEPSPSREERDDGAALEAAIERAMAKPNRQAVAELTALQKKHPASAAVVFALGTQYFARPWPSEALKAYRNAIELDPSYRSNPTIIAHAIELLSSRSSRWAAQRLLERDIGDAALPALDAAAREHPSSTIRKRAAAVARTIRRS